MIAVAASSKWESNAQMVRFTKLESVVTRLPSEVDVVKQLRAEVASRGRDIEKMNASFTDKANMRDETVKRADNLSSQRSASFCSEDAYLSELSALKKNLAKIATSTQICGNKLTIWF